jgi:hypothetical protein
MGIPTMHRCRSWLLLGALACWPTPAHADETDLTPEQAAGKVGETVTMVMKVKNAGSVSDDSMANLVSEYTLQHKDAFFVRVSAGAKE